MRTFCLGARRPGLINLVLPGAAAAETHGEAPEWTMSSTEAAAVADAVLPRRREFGTVRFVARRALLQLGVPAVSIVPDADGVPCWPVGVVGSMTHCEGYRAAVVAPASELSSVGVDAEPHAALPDAVLDLVMRDEERARLVVLAGADPSVHWDRVTFCVKEAVYKTWFPLTRRWLDFADVSTTIDRDGTFSACVRVDAPRVAADVHVFDGRWVVGRGLVVAATTVRASHAANTPAPSALSEVVSR
jgi:4'-phosphopantetheinyl transferase EntD